MSNNKSLSDLIIDLQDDNVRLKFLWKLFAKACQQEFGFDVKTIHHMLEKQRLYEQRKAEKQGQHSSISSGEMEMR